MPTYVFRCSGCGRTVEKETRTADICGECGKPLDRVFVAPHVIVRGGSRTDAETDRMLADYYRGQDELSRGELTDTEMDEGYSHHIDRCKKSGTDPRYFLGNAPKLTKEEMKKKADEQREMVERSLIQNG